MEDAFSWMAQWRRGKLGKPYTFALPYLVVTVQGASVPFYSDTWQLVINTRTTIVTSLMILLLRSTQNRDPRLIQLKFDELTRANENARDAPLGLEPLSDADMRRIQAKFLAVAKLGAVPD